MREPIQWIKNEMPREVAAGMLALFSDDQRAKIRNFHRSFPQYNETPLVHLKNLSEQLGIGGLYVKDESFRFGLNSFKVLGGTYAVGRYVAQRLGKDISQISYDTFLAPETKEAVGEITFYTVTDGNHGRGVAWAANKLGQKSVIRMPHGSSEARVANIRAEGADVQVMDLNYDDAIRVVARMAESDPNGVLVQDTDWVGYEQIPSWIVQGYSTVAAEAHEQLQSLGIWKPTHIFLQAGVGAFAGSIQGYFASIYGEDCPTTTVVEASAANCHYRSALAGRRIPVGGDLSTIMAGLACGEACGISWDILKNNAKFFTSVSDWVTAYGMRMLGAPCKGDTRIISGESGAVTAGLVAALMTDDANKDFREALNLNESSIVLVVSTEGDTDPVRYKDIVWNGYCPS
ncbi:MAG: diaminopropionate ammonia-lyase [Clostridiales Family XIII bacterium]|jgi:diaminopropionate ammonia-lyase|nr:diaminopropionate ammonia-lyase [Clostridiales Family XIII bacterium]